MARISGIGFLFFLFYITFSSKVFSFWHVSTTCLGDSLSVFHLFRRSSLLLACLLLLEIAATLLFFSFHRCKHTDSNKQSTAHMAFTAMESQTDRIESTTLPVSSLRQPHLKTRSPCNPPRPANRPFLPPTSHIISIPTSVSSETVVAARLQTSSS